MRTVQDVVRRNLCISCGACESAAPEGAIELAYSSSDGLYLPQILDESQTAGGGAEFAVCPGKGVPYRRLHSELFGEDLNSCPKLGSYRSAYAVRAQDATIAQHASSGGVMTAIAAYLLEKGDVDGVVVNAFTYGDGPFRTEVYVARNREELLRAQGSKYCPTMTNSIVRSCAESGERYLFVGTPCQVAALRMAAERDSTVKAAFPLTMGNFCGGLRTYGRLYSVLKRCGIDPSNCASFRFRGDGWPGSLRVEDRSGRVIQKAYPDYDADLRLSKPSRCTLCIDGTALLADFACGDAWLERFLQTGHGWSLVLARSERADSILEDMTKDELLIREDVSRDEILRSQSINLSSKIDRQASRRRAFALLGIALPEYDVSLPRGPTSILFELYVYFSKKLKAIYHHLRRPRLASGSKRS